MEASNIPQWVWFIGFLFCYGIVIVFWLNGDRIRESQGWFVAWLGYMLSLIMAFKCYIMTGLPTG